MELAQRRQAAQVAQVEELEELLRGAVQQRPARLVALADDLDQVPLEQRLDDRAAVHPADVLDLGPGHRLAVGDDRQRLERGAGEPLRLDLEEAAHELRVGRVGAKLPAARDLVQDDAAHPVAIVALKLLELLVDDLDGQARHLAYRLLAQRLVGHEQQRLEDGANPLGREALRLGGELLERRVHLLVDRRLDGGGLDVLKRVRVLGLGLLARGQARDLGRKILVGGRSRVAGSEPGRS